MRVVRRVVMLWYVHYKQCENCTTQMTNSAAGRGGAAGTYDMTDQWKCLAASRADT